jgi:hypothetical protein
VRGKIEAVMQYKPCGRASGCPNIWTADPDKIIAAANRGRQVLDSIH